MAGRAEGDALSGNRRVGPQVSVGDEQRVNIHERLGWRRLACERIDAGSRPVVAGAGHDGPARRRR